MDIEESKSLSEGEYDDSLDVGDGENMDADWYHESDTGEEVPDPNMQKEALFQKPNTVPVGLSKNHFEEGLYYFMVLDKDHDKPMLVMILETGIDEFVYRVFYIRGSSAKTYHEAGKDKTATYEEVWRLAPRMELVQDQDIATIFVGQTLRLSHWMDVKWDTIVVTMMTSTSVSGIMLSGTNRGSTVTIDKTDIANCKELFGSPLLHNILDDVKDLK